MITTAISRQKQILKQGENEHAIIEVCDDGIMYVQLKADMEIGLEEAQAVFELSLEVGEGIAFPNLIRLNKLLIPTKEAREFVASEERAVRAKAEAFILNSLPQRIVGNFYLRFNKPPVPSKLFTSEEEALAWLRTFVD